MYWRLVELAIQAMSPSEFEDLVFALVRREDERAEQLGPPDAGRDTIVSLADGGELVWQAKHHTGGIDWAKCEESLQSALADRDPREVTFVFPVKMTARKEGGLTDLRRRYPQVKINKPWTLPDVRSQLAKADDVRRELIDRPIGVDELHVRQMLERAAERDQASERQTSAAMLGPLAAAGQDAALAEAEALSERGDLRGASERFARIAAAIEGSMSAVANAVRLRAAWLAAEDNDRQRAARLYLDASRSAARRGDDAAEFAAFRASWLMPDDERWRALAAMARASWPERPDDALPVLRDAFARAMQLGEPEAILEWSVALCEALASEEDWAGVLEAAERARPSLQPVAAVDERLELELEWLAAGGELGKDVDRRWRQLLLSPVGRTSEGAALIRARWGLVLARAGHGDRAAEEFRGAAERWRAVGDAEDEIAEAILSEDVVAQISGHGRLLDQPGRIAVGELRGRKATAAAVADRKVTAGLRAWLAERGWDARRQLVIAWSMHRRAGHLGGTLRVAETLHDLFKTGQEWEEALPWAIRCGKQLATERVAQRVGWARVADRVWRAAPEWERGAMWEAIAATGADASDTEIADLVEALLAAASDHETDERATVQAAAASRRALAAILCRAPEDRRDEVVAEVVYETTHTPFPPKRTIEGLILATDAGVCDEAALIAETFGYTDRAHLAGFGLAVELITRSGAATAIAVDLASDQFPALLLCAWAGLPDRHPEIANRARDVIARSLEAELRADEILRHDDKGRLARWAPPEHQKAVAKTLLDTLVSPSEIGAHRYEAAVGLGCLAERLSPDSAERVLDEFSRHANDMGAPSIEDGMRSHPNPLFARIKMDAPRASNEVRAAALRAATLLAQQAQHEDRARDVVRAGLTDQAGAVRAEAVGLARAFDEIDVRVLADDDDALVRAHVLSALAAGDNLRPDDPVLLDACAGHQPLVLRSTAARVLRDRAGRDVRAVHALMNDPHVYVRAIAHAMIRS